MAWWGAGVARAHTLHACCGESLKFSVLARQMTSLSEHWQAV